MSNEDRTQEAGVKKAKRIASIIYIIAMTFIVGSSWLHQQQASVEIDEEETIEFNKF